MPHGTWEYSPGRLFPFTYRTIAFYGYAFQRIQLEKSFVTSRKVCCLFCEYPATLKEQRQQAIALSEFRLFPFRSPLLGEYHSVSFPPGTEMFHFPGLTPYTIRYRVSRHYPGWVAPFGNLRIKGYLHLTAAYRSLPRPSSSAPTKPSTISSL